MDIKIDVSWFRFLADLPPEEIKKVVCAIWDYSRGEQVPDIDSAAWETIKAIIDYEIQHKAELSIKRRDAAKSRWHKEPIVSDSVPKTQPETIAPEIILPENKFLSLTDNSEIRNALINENSDLSIFLETGAGYDTLSISERKFADRPDVREKCTWHKEMQAAAKVIKRKPFCPPTLEEWLDFCREKNLNLEKMRNAYESYGVADWHDSQGNPIRNWKQKILQVWAAKPQNYNQQTAKFGAQSEMAKLQTGIKMAEVMLKKQGII